MKRLSCNLDSLTEAERIVAEAFPEIDFAAIEAERRAIQAELAAAIASVDAMNTTKKKEVLQ